MLLIILNAYFRDFVWAHFEDSYTNPFPIHGPVLFQQTRAEVAAEKEMWGATLIIYV